MGKSGKLAKKAKMKKLPSAQRRILRRVAKTENQGFIWFKCTYRHDMEIFRKLERRGYVAREVRKHGRGWIQDEYLTPKGWAASGIKQEIGSKQAWWRQ